MASYSQEFIKNKVELLKDEIESIKRGKLSQLVKDENERQKYLKQLEDELKKWNNMVEVRF